jgi:Terminase large subunit, T4likevirus-type, N-terminal
MTRTELLAVLPSETGESLAPLSWWPRAEQALDDAQCRIVVISAPRQSGKSSFLAREAVHRLLTPDSYCLFICASEQQSHAVFNRKFRRPVERMLKTLAVSKRSVVVTRKSIDFLDLNSRLEVPPSSEFSSPGRSIDLLCLDEGRDIDDGIFATLLPSVLASRGAKVLVASTAGRPSGWFYQLVTQPPEGCVVIEAINENPRADEKVIGTIRRVLGRIAPAFAERELSNRFVEDEVSHLLPPALILDAVDARLGELPTSEKPAYAALDLARKVDLASLVVVVREAGRGENRDHLTVASIQTWDPKSSLTGEVDFSEIRAALGRLPARFPHLGKLLVDQGAESAAVMPFLRAHPGLTLATEGIVGSVDLNMKLWGALAGRIHERSLSIPAHQRLLDELHNLRTESFSLGSRYRVIDSSRKYHRDLSWSLAAACYAAGEAGAPPVEFVGEAEPNLTVLRGGQALDGDGTPLRGGFWRGGDRRARVGMWR